MLRCGMCDAVLAGRRRRWCDNRCRDRWRGSVRSVETTCAGCDATFLVPVGRITVRKFCGKACGYRHRQMPPMTGEANPRWRGGRALSYGPEWKSIKARVRERDGVCRSCGKSPGENGRALDVHHLDPFRFSGDNSMENLVALCRSCHMRADDHGRRGSATFLHETRPRGPTKRELRRARQRVRAEETSARRTTDKQRAFDLHARGLSLRAIAKEVGVSHQTVANWLGGVHEPGEPYPALLVS